MSEEPSQDKPSHPEKKKSRRSKKDEGDRNFLCPCGKSYLSYPALYTHIKTKHDGKAPTQSQQKIEKKNEQSKEEKNPLLSIKENLQRHFPGQKIANQSVNTDSQLTNSLLKSWEEVRQLQPFSDDSRNSETTIDLIFGRFLFEMRSKLCNAAYSYLCEFVSCFLKSIMEENQDRNLYKRTNGSQLPYCFNGLVVNGKLPTFNGSPEEQNTLNCKILYSFGNWIFEQQYTNFSVKLNPS